MVCGEVQQHSCGCGGGRDGIRDLATRSHVFDRRARQHREGNVLPQIVWHVWGAPVRPSRGGQRWLLPLRRSGDWTTLRHHRSSVHHTCRTRRPQEPRRLRPWHHKRANAGTHAADAVTNIHANTITLSSSHATDTFTNAKSVWHRQRARRLAARVREVQCRPLSRRGHGATMQNVPQLAVPGARRCGALLAMQGMRRARHSCRLRRGQQGPLPQVLKGAVREPIAAATVTGFFSRGYRAAQGG
jgi:hypothetical protein